MKRIVTLVTVVALATPSAAFAESSTCQAYKPQTCEPVTTSSSPESTPAGPTATTSHGTLPFTGVDVGLLAVGGGTLLGAGFAVRRLSSRPDQN